jgi:HEAT repeat protein
MKELFEGEGGRMRIVRTALALLSALALCVSPASAESKREEAQKLMKKLAKSHDPEERQSAAERLGSMGATDAVPALALALKDKEPAVRAAAAAALWELKEAARDAMPELKEALNDSDGAVLINAAGALRGLDVVTTDLLPAYKRALNDPDCGVAVLAGLAAQEFLPPQDMLRVAKNCQKAEDIEVQMRAGDLLRAATKSGGKDLIPSLLENLRRAHGADKADFARALGDQKPPTAELAAALIPLIPDAEPENRKAAIQSLKYMGASAKDAVPAIIERLTADKDPEVRKYAAEALGELAPYARAAIPVLIQVLQKDASAEVRAAACEGLQEQHEAAKAAIPALHAALLDKDAFVRGAAQRALMRVEPHQ